MRRRPKCMALRSSSSNRLDYLLRRTERQCQNLKLDQNCEEWRAGCLLVAWWSRPCHLSSKWKQIELIQNSEYQLQFKDGGRIANWNLIGELAEQQKPWHQYYWCWKAIRLFYSNSNREASSRLRGGFIACSQSDQLMVVMMVKWIDCPDFARDEKKKSKTTTLCGQFTQERNFYDIRTLIR